VLPKGKKRLKVIGTTINTLLVLYGSHWPGPGRGHTWCSIGKQKFVVEVKRVIVNKLTG
jgi:hypothetical protein